jgi:hypothetical protein
MTPLQKIDTVLKCLFDKSADDPNREKIQEWLKGTEDLDLDDDLRDCLKKLHNDGFVYFIKEGSYVDEYNDNYNFSISFEGKLFWITEGGYDQKRITQEAENTRLGKLEIENRANQKWMTWLTVLLAVGTLFPAMLAIAELVHYHGWFQSRFWWKVCVVVVLLAAMTSYLIWKLLPPKKQRKE